VAEKFMESGQVIELKVAIGPAIPGADASEVIDVTP
jgi:hypothetical protein